MATDATHSIESKVSTEPELPSDLVGILGRDIDAAKSLWQISWLSFVKTRDISLDMTRSKEERDRYTRAAYVLRETARRAKQLFLALHKIRHVDVELMAKKAPSQNLSCQTKPAAPLVEKKSLLGKHGREEIIKTVQ